MKYRSMTFLWSRASFFRMTRVFPVVTKEGFHLIHCLEVENHLEHGLSWVFLQRTASHFGHAVSKPEPALSFEHIFTSKPEQPLATLLEDLISGSFKGTAGGKPDH